MLFFKKIKTMTPKKFILSIRPKEYLTQGPSHCGVYSVKAILSAYDLDTKNHPGEYHPSWFGRLTGATLGRDYYPRILEAYGLKASILTADKLPVVEKLDILKKLLAKNTPVMIRIGNGYDTDKYNPITGKIVGHWIGLPKKYWSKNISTGNTVRTYQEILRDWSFGKLQPWTWPFVGFGNFLYIQVEK
ncbi:hypothetical protein HY085_00010 [Candidatus Gottesmanbacteria bacterium]|nr:hypothetical protein [Candidatus Gottesmanbacteria bacterium]